MDILYSRINNKPRSKIGAVLLDQKLIAGIGNYMRCDILWYAKLHYTRTIGSLTEKERLDLYNAVKVLTFHYLNRNEDEDDYCLIYYKSIEYFYMKPIQRYSSYLLASYLLLTMPCYAQNTTRLKLEEAIHLALQNTSKNLLVHVEEFTVYADSEKQHHHWYVALNQHIDKELFINMLDEELKQLNDDYTSARKYTLKNPEITLLNSNSFYQFLEKQGKLGAQNKFPRVMNSTQHKIWSAHLEE